LSGGMIYISLGSNMGNRLSALRDAARLIKTNILTHSYESIVIETKALLKEGAPASWNKPYLNMVIAGKSDLSPVKLLEALKNIEEKIAGSRYKERWSPRVIDLDILIYNDQTIQAPGLNIPHAELLNRDFLLHLLALMPEEYMPLIQTNSSTAPSDGAMVRADEYAHGALEYAGLFDKSFSLAVPIAGILNVTPDSFSDGGKNSSPEMAIENAKQMVLDGAEIIDIGAQSTRPGGIEIIGAEKEYERLAPVLDGLKDLDAKISIDTYHPALIRRLLKEYKIDWINDVTGNLEDDILQEISAAGCKILTMHSLSVPPSPANILPHAQEGGAISLLKEWGRGAFERMQRLGFSAEDIILDPGIGFGKSIYQNLALIRQMQELQELQELGVSILVGHSRKSFIFGLSTAPAKERDIETMVMSGNLASKVDFIRVHNVYDHHRALIANQLSL